MKILPRSFYDRDTPKVARDLIGKLIVRRINGQTLIGMIAETEAYRSDDPASHAYRGETQSNSELFGPVGHAYIYLSYGIHNCLNLVSRDTKRYAGGGILIRAIIPIEGFREKQKRINGPGNVTKALHINRSLRGTDVTKSSSPIVVTEGDTFANDVVNETARIGISKAQDIPWRYVLSKEVKVVPSVL
jgi:DNA-3-methyladenine glycosylase